MELNNEQKDILRMILRNELDFYETKEEVYPEDEEYISELKKILNIVNKEGR